MKNKQGYGCLKIERRPICVCWRR